jgi:hypothetical protein
VYISYAPLPGLDVFLVVGIVKNVTGDSDAPLVGSGEAGDAIQKSGFPSARCTEENGEAGECTKMHVQVEGALGIRKALADANFEVRGDGFPNR